jgi:hypothetical protein
MLIFVCQGAFQVHCRKAEQMLENQCQVQGSALAERRNSARLPVIKSAKLLVGSDSGQGVYNCLVLDESRAGALLDLGAMFTLPEEMTLNMSSGASYRVRRRWAVGTKVGVEFLGTPSVSADAAGQMNRLADLLRHQGVPAAVAALRAQNCFDHEPLRVAVAEAEAAYLRLESILKQTA